MWVEEAEVRLEQCEVEGSRIGLIARSNARVTMTRCACSEASDTAVVVEDGARLRLESSTIQHCGNAGVHVQGLELEEVRHARLAHLLSVLSLVRVVRTAAVATREGGG
jgi:hypothetical protein